MFDIIKSVIERGIFRVNDISLKIDTLWAESKLTDSQRDGLYSLIMQHLNPATEYPELEDRIASLEARVSALEEAQNNPDIGDPSEPEGSPEGAEIWEPWDGASNKYQPGAIVIHNGTYYKNVLVGQQNVWEPGSPGIDDRFWAVVSEDEI